MRIADILKIDDVLAPTTLERILQEMRAAEGEAATVLGATPQQRVTATARKATQVGVGEATYSAVLQLLDHPGQLSDLGFEAIDAHHQVGTGRLHRSGRVRSSRQTLAMLTRMGMRTSITD